MRNRKSWLGTKSLTLEGKKPDKNIDPLVVKKNEEQAAPKCAVRRSVLIKLHKIQGDKEFGTGTMHCSSPFIFYNYFIPSH